MHNSNDKEQIVSLLPLPESLKNLSLVPHAETHWTDTANHIMNLMVSDSGNQAYAIGFKLVRHPSEMSAIKYKGQYFSPLLLEPETLPFRVVFELEAQVMFNFHECHQRPPTYFDFVSSEATVSSCTGCIQQLQLGTCPLMGEEVGGVTACR